MRFKPRPFTEPVPFRCLYCLDCCRGRHIYLTLDDIERIARAGHDPQDFVTFSVEGNKIRFVLAVREWDLGCVFHDPETGKCRVHDANPIICRIYPFMVSRKPLGVDGEMPFEYMGQRLWLYYDDSCPGINAEEPETTITPEEIAELGLRFEREFERTDMDGFVKLLDELER
ncbi:YkgJ family cysteine cluster protein [Thermococcus indicus]|uniref:YkgJ family cysteine cluster protein n=1 Tax=Thermococcus indicus TaxID=2586643 RepID=A0A4Y5SK31_9EURY|nr:YkgJ family cysteine cluster protein [Thermococcus indicus]QDA30509.1 YkgJ family cysteine cluster protein [Thermococcus indicus]